MKYRSSNNRVPELLDELVCEGCSNSYCFIKTFVESLNPKPFVLIQLKCIEYFKWEESEKKGFDIGWEEACMRWAIDGYASCFNHVFDEELTAKDNYRLTMEKVKNLKDKN